MDHFMSRFDARTYALMRIVVGILFLTHGAQKLFGYPVPLPPGAPLFIVYTAGPIEFFGGLLIAIGLFTNWTAFICSGQMAVAYWMAHGTNSLFPLINGGEPAVVFCFVFLFISANGPGIWSVDAVRKK